MKHYRDYRKAPKCPGVYGIEVNHKFYVGRTNNLRRRISYHICRLKDGRHPNKHLLASFHKYRIINVYTLEELVTCDNLVELEQKYIDHVGHYNKSDAKDGAQAGELNHFYGREHTQETKDKISKANKGRKQTQEQKKAQILAQTGKKRILSREGKANIAKSNRTRNTGVPKNKKIVDFWSEKTGKISCTQYELRTKFSLSPGNVSAIVKGKRNKHKGFYLHENRPKNN